MVSVPYFCGAGLTEWEKLAKSRGRVRQLCKKVRQLEQRIKELSGLKFSDRNYNAMKSRMETAEREAAEMKVYLEKIGGKCQKLQGQFLPMKRTLGPIDTLDQIERRLTEGDSSG
ncbi:MAG: hypothetical protein FVQ81_01920 [Candidatus Glassbacteria bacterium]|nr:hypothetical protein [Candidatus Glassbacteria bacterium]